MTSDDVAPEPPPDSPPPPLPSTPPPERLIHQQLLGVALRAGAAVLVSLPLVLVSWTWGKDWAFLPTALGITGLVAFCLFAVERRGASAGQVALRLYLGATVVVILIPAAMITLSHAGDFEGAVGGLAQELNALEPPFGLGIMALGICLFPYLYFYVRARTRRLVPQLLAFALPVSPATIPAMIDEPGWLIAWPLCACLFPFAVVRLDRRLEEWDPHAPQPDEQLNGKHVAKALGLLIVLFFLITLMAIPNLIEARVYSNEQVSIGALKTLGNAQALFREGDKEQDEWFDYAGSLAELGETGVIDDVLAGGKKNGYYFRVIHSHTTSEFLWSAAADPVVPQITGWRYFATNHTGVTFYTDAGPIPLDPELCDVDLNPSLLPVGR